MPAHTRPPQSPVVPCLRFHKGSAAPARPVRGAGYKFPAPNRAAAHAVCVPRIRLVAATVTEESVERNPGSVATVDGSCELIRGIESTLDRMQTRLDRFRDEVEGAFKFPGPVRDPEFPPAA